MYIVFGSRAYFRTNKVVRHGFCLFCNRFAKLQSFDARTCFHLYYIPLIPTEGRRRNHDICSVCSQGQTYEPETFEQIIENFRERSADAIIALKNREQTIPSGNLDQDPIECIPYLHSAIDWFYAANDRDFCESILAQLNDPQLRFAQAMTRAALETAQGSIDEAIESYSNAIQANSKSVAALRSQAQLLGEKKRYDECLAAYQAACAASDEATKYALMLELVDFQMTAKKHMEAATTYDWLLQANPDLEDNKKFMKLVNTARKKAGIKKV